MTFQGNPNAVEDIKKMAVQTMEAPARRAVEATVCPD